MNINFEIKTKIRKDKVHKLVKAIEETNLFSVKNVLIKNKRFSIYDKLIFNCQSNEENFKDIFKDEENYFNSILENLKPKYILAKSNSDVIDMSLSSSEKMNNLFKGYNKEELILWQN